MAAMYLLPGSIMKRCRWTLLLTITPESYFLIKIALYLSVTLSPVLILSNFPTSIPAEVPTNSATKCCRNGSSLKFVPEELVFGFTRGQRKKSIVLDKCFLERWMDFIPRKECEEERGGGLSLRSKCLKLHIEVSSFFLNLELLFLIEFPIIPSLSILAYLSVSDAFPSGSHFPPFFISAICHCGI